LSAVSDLSAHLTAALADRYLLERELGQGGMATVYLAQDLKHDRKVALKVLRPELAAVLGAERFVQEIKTTAQLQHPHILPLFDSGSADGFLYYVMPYVEGETLRAKLDREGQLAVEEALEITKTIAGALDFAHTRGIVHRDIKPENVLLQDGVPLVADFGIAVAVSTAGGDRLTETGLSLGTPAYMSPEQAAGERDLDARSDVYALGCLTYEMLAGDPPFVARNAAAVIARHLTDTAPPITTVRRNASKGIAAALARALNKAPADRPASAGAFASELRAEGAATAGEPVILVVLPFVNRSQDPENEYFSDGLTEEVIADLSKVSALRVISRNSAMTLKGTTKDTPTLAKELGVSHVVTGSVRRAGSALRVTAELVEARTDKPVWSEKYAGTMEDVFGIQEEIARKIVAALKMTLTESEERQVAARPRHPTDNLEAYELYLKGRHYWHQRTPAAVRVAIQCFEQTIARDAGYALAYCGLADCYGILRVYGWTRAAENRAQAQAAVERAMAIDPSLAEANFSKAFYTFYFERNWRTARPYFEKAVALNPKSPLMQTYSGLFAAMEGRAVDVAKWLQAGVELDPLSPFIHGLASTAYYQLGQFAEAERASRRSLELQPDYLLGIWTHGLAMCGLGRATDAIPPLERATAMSRAPFFLCLLGLGYALAGRTDDARRLLAELDERATRGEYVAAFSRLAIHVGLGDVPAIRRELAAALDEVTPPFSLRVTSGPFLDRYRTDPEIERRLAAWFEGNVAGEKP
jgi:serine/threonine protein kinase